MVSNLILTVVICKSQQKGLLSQYWIHPLIPPSLFLPFYLPSFSFYSHPIPIALEVGPF